MTPIDPAAPTALPVQDFVREIVAEDQRAGVHVRTRFPPEPNGYLHIGHAKAVCLDFGVAQEFSGACNLRFDDTNPTREDTEFVDAIMADVRWLGFDWAGLHYASDYFDLLYRYAQELVRAGKAYVDSLSAEEIRAHRGTLTERGRNSPFRDRSVDDNLDLFARMRVGEFPDGAHVLRAKIDMGSPNINMRDPTLYRIRHASHHRTGSAWCLYPTYDYSHPVSDALEGITHSLCTLEFEDHRPLYDWVIEQLRPVAAEFASRPRQIEFARLNLSYTITSKRKLLALVEQHHVTGWDDPRMPTLAGMRRRGYTPESIRNFCSRIGVAKKENLIDMALLEHSVREDLNHRAPRALAVLRPLKVVIENHAPDTVDELEAVNNPEDPGAGVRRIPFGREIYIERDDFMEDPPKKFFRLSPGSEVRLRYGYIVKCESVVKDAAGSILELRCSYDPESLSGSTASRRVKGTLHWVSARHGIRAEVRLYERLFLSEEPGAGGRDPLSDLNPASCETVVDAVVEPLLAVAPAGSQFQFERLGYFTVDPDSRAGRPVFNRTVTLKDTWAKLVAKV